MLRIAEIPALGCCSIKLITFLRDVMQVLGSDFRNGDSESGLNSQEHSSCMIRRLFHCPLVS